MYSVRRCFIATDLANVAHGMHDNLHADHDISKRGYKIISVVSEENPTHVGDTPINECKHAQ